ncbi:MAG: hypothetical protein ACYTGQ_06905 [Planctomycetota bacterium]|jgi:hypothetical protein
MRFTVPFILTALLCATTFHAPPARAQDQQAFDSAVWLLKKSTLIHRDGKHNFLLRALRQMRDPNLKPLFSDLVQRPTPVLQIHGVLGLGEISEAGLIDLAHVANLQDTPTQLQLITSALSNKLLSDEQAQQLLTWPSLDIGIKIIIATHLIQNDALLDTTVLDEAMASPQPAIAATAALLSLQLGDEAAGQLLDETHKLEKSQRHTFQTALLKTAIRYDLHAIGPWALNLVDAADNKPELVNLALQTAIDADAPHATDTWVRLFNATDSVAEQTRLALLALELHQNVKPVAFQLMRQSGTDVIQQAGLVAQLLATGQNATEPILDLLGLNNVLASQWVSLYANTQSIDVSQRLLVGIVLAAEGDGNPARFRDQRLINTVLATKSIVEKEPDPKPIVQNLLNHVPELTQEAVIMGLIRAEHPQPQSLLEGFDNFKSSQAKAMATILRARYNTAVSLDELKTLSLIVRGGAGLEDTLRVQASWIYLKATNQQTIASAQILSQ